MELTFATLFVIPTTFKLGFVLASCYFAGAIATELSHAALKVNPFIPIVLLWVGAHQPARAAGRAGTVPSEVVLGGRKVAIQRPRVRSAAGEVPFPTFEHSRQWSPASPRLRTPGRLLSSQEQRGNRTGLEPVLQRLHRRSLSFGSGTLQNDGQRASRRR
jgi:hypothetical protein